MEIKTQEDSKSELKNDTDVEFETMVAQFDCPKDEQITKHLIDIICPPRDSKFNIISSYTV